MDEYTRQWDWFIMGTQQKFPSEPDVNPSA